MTSLKILNKILIDNMEEQLKILFDNSEDSPKLITRSGKFTKKFLDWNKKKLRDGLTIHYADKDYLYNPTTERIIKKDFKKDGNERKKSLKKARQGSTLITNTGEFEKLFLPENYSEGDYNGVRINTHDWWFPILKKFEGHHIRIIIKYYIKNPNSIIEGVPAKEFIETLQETHNGAFNFIYDNSYDIPAPFPKNAYNQQNWYNEFMIDSDYPNIVAYLLANGIKTRVIITKLLDLPDKKIFQSFRDGSTHCVLQPILDYFKDAFNNQPSKKSKEKNRTAINHIEGKYLKKTKKHKDGFLDKYKYGIPEDELQLLCDKLQIGIIIDKPFSNTPFINVRSHNKPRKIFRFLNSRFNHVSFNHGKHTLTTMDYDKDNIIELNKDHLEIKKNELKESGDHYVYNRNKFGITAIRTYDNIFKLPNEYRELCKEFETANSINSFRINALKYPDLQNFINRGCHFNTTIDFQDLPDINHPDLRHIDMYKAYTQYEKCNYYNGFLGKITDFRKVDNYEQKGYYYINNLSFKNANKKFVFYNSRFQWFLNRNIYTDAELRFLKDQGVTFKVYCGAYGTKTEFKFSKELINGKIKLTKINGKEIKISMYAKLVGEWASVRYNKEYYMDGIKDYFHGIKTSENNIYYDDDRQEAKISYPAQTVYNNKHLSGQITAYQRLLMMEQLLDMDETKIIRVCVDGIYYYNHNITTLDIFRDKTKEMTFQNSPSTSYLSNIFAEGDDSIIGIKIADARPFYKTEMWLGQGGTGKTYQNIRDVGGIDKLYLCPPWKLARSVQGDIKENKLVCDVNVNARVLTMEFCERLQEKYNVFLWDEVSQMTERTKNHIINTIHGKHIFMGDIGYQLEPLINHRKCEEEYKKENSELKYYEWLNLNGYCEINPDENIDNIITLTTDRRAKECKDLQEVKLQLREFIDMLKYKKREEKDKIRQQVLEYIKSKCDKIELDELDQNYKVSDMILASTHEIKDEYTLRYNHLDKFLVKNNTKDYSNSEIIYKIPNEFVKVEKQHAFTIHSIQGETIDKEDNLYIDLRKMFSDNHIYTAVSRARNLKQIKLIY
jgi:hypothetical protein